MADLRIVAADNVKGSGLDLLRQAFGEDVVEARGKYTDEELQADIGRMDALIVRSGTKVTRAAIEKAGGRLKLIGRAGVGTDNIDKDAATERGIVVMNTPMGNTVSAAEQAIALIFATARNIARADRMMQQGTWAKKELVGVEVQDKVLGLVGLGKIGSHVATVLRAAGMTIVAYDPYLPPERAKQIGVEIVELDDLLKRADFISLHTPLTDATKNLLSKEKIALMKPGARLVNCARGGIVDEAAVAEAVREKRLAAAGFDVFSSEPMTEGPLFGVDDLTLTPHLGASTEEATERCGQQMAEQIIAYFKQGEIRNAVNLEITIDPELQPYVRLARSMGRLGAALLETAPERVEVACSGRLEESDTGEITASAVQGVLEAFGPEDVNVVNAYHMAQARSIEIGETRGRATQTFVSLIELALTGSGRTVRILGTAYDGVSPRIVGIDGFEVDIRPSEHVLFLTYPDRPGYIAKFSAVLAERDINIANMEVARLARQGAALVAFTLDDRPCEKTMKALEEIEGVEAATLVSF